MTLHAAPGAPNSRENIRTRRCVGFTPPRRRRCRGKNTLRGRWWRQNAKKIHLLLAFGCEGGGSGGSGIEIIKRSTSGSHLDAREVVVVADVLKCQKDPPPARVRMRGRLEAVEAALKPLNSPPLARFWTQGRRKRGGRHGFALSFRSGGEVSNLSGNGRIDDENEP